MDHANGHALEEREGVELAPLGAGDPGEMEPAEPPVKRKKVARDPERRQLEAEAEAARRAVRKALKDRDLEKLQEISSRAKAKPKGDAPATPAEVSAVVVTAPIAPPDPRGAAWPSPVKVAEFRELVQQLVTASSMLLQGTRFALDGATAVDLNGQKVIVSKQAMLVDALAPLAAKYAPEQANTPEAAAAMALFAVFGAPAIGLAVEKLTAAIEAKRTAAAAQVGRAA